MAGLLAYGDSLLDGKAGRGWRPDGLPPGLVRRWARARLAIAREWQRLGTGHSSLQSAEKEPTSRRGDKRLGRSLPPRGAGWRTRACSSSRSRRSGGCLLLAPGAGQEFRFPACGSPLLHRGVPAVARGRCRRGARLAPFAPPKASRRDRCTPPLSCACSSSRGWTRPSRSAHGSSRSPWTSTTWVSSRRSGSAWPSAPPRTRWSPRRRRWSSGSVATSGTCTSSRRGTPRSLGRAKGGGTVRYTDQQRQRLRDLKVRRLLCRKTRRTAVPYGRAPC